MWLYMPGKAFCAWREAACWDWRCRASYFAALLCRGGLQPSERQAFAFQAMNSARVQGVSWRMSRTPLFFGCCHSHARVEAMKRFGAPLHTQDQGWPASAVTACPASALAPRMSDIA